MERISGEKQTHGEKRGPWEKDSQGESFADGEVYGLTSGHYGSGD